MMKQEDIFKKIGLILTELEEQYQFLAQNPQQLNDLELELFQANANFLSEHVQIIKKLNALKPSAAKEDLVSESQDFKDDLTSENAASAIEVEEVADEKLESVAKAEEAEERVDVVPEQEILDEEEIHESTTEKVLEYDFFKPDNDDHTFEFDLGKNRDVDEDKFDFEKVPAIQWVDRKISEAEAQIFNRTESDIEQLYDENNLVEDEPTSIEEDEIGPEPFLISTDKPEASTDQKPEIEKRKFETYDPKFDDEIISPKVEQEQPAFTPSALPINSNAVEEMPAAKSLNDLLAKTKTDPGEIKAPISDLKQSINLNEKLLFIKDLFNGYNMAYSEAVEIVNKMSSFEMADSFLQSNYAVKNNWASKQNTVDQLYELLNRRFIKGS